MATTFHRGSAGEPHKGAGKSTGYRAVPEKLARLEAEAKRRGWSLQQFIDFALDEFLKVQRIARRGRWS